MENSARSNEALSLTIIVPTYNRTGFLKRLLSYLADACCSHHILILDSSDELQLDQNDKTIKTFENRISIQHIPCLSTSSVAEKIERALTLAQSKYTAICADDDLIVPSALDICAEYLEQHPDYAVVRGRGIFVTVYPGRLEVENYPQLSIELPEPHLRLKCHLMEYTTTFYGVHRRSELLYNYRMMKRFSQERTPALRELIPSCLTLMTGKSKGLELLYSVRQWHAEGVYSTERPWAKLLFSSEFHQYYSGFRECLATALSSKTQMSIQMSRQLVHQAFFLYLSSPSMERVLTNAIMSVSNAPHAVARATVKQELIPKFLKETRIGNNNLLISEMMTLRTLMRQQEAEIRLDTLLSGKSAFSKDFLPAFSYIACYPQGMIL